MAVGVSSSQSLRCAGGRQIPRPRSRQSQLPGSCLLAPGMYCLTHRAAPPTLSRDAPGPGQSPPRASPACPAAGRASDRPPGGWPGSRRAQRLPISYRSSAISSDAITSMRASPLGPAATLIDLDPPFDLAGHRLQMLLLAVLAADGVCVAVDANGNLRHRMILAFRFNRPCRRAPRADDRSIRRVAPQLLRCPPTGIDLRACASSRAAASRDSLQCGLQPVGRRFRILGVAGHCPLSRLTVPHELKARRGIERQADIDAGPVAGSVHPAVVVHGLARRAAGAGRRPAGDAAVRRRGGAVRRLRLVARADRARPC